MILIQTEGRAMIDRLNALEKMLTDNTVLNDWFTPVKTALEKVRYSEKKYHTLSMPTFILQNCVRQINTTESLRDHLQHLFHLDERATQLPLARSTYSDALSNKGRLDITMQVSKHLADSATQRLPDRLASLEDIKGRAVYAGDGSYQTESSHFTKVTPSQGGCDSSKGHLLMTIFNLRAGIPVGTEIDTESISEIRFLKERWSGEDLTRQKNSLWVIDRAYVDAPFWDIRKKKHGVSMITRMKSNLNYQVVKDLKVTSSNKKQGIKKDQIIQLDSSQEQWRLIGYKSHTGEHYEYLSNEFDVASGVIAYLYHRRWDEEKYFDNFKNDLSNAKAWGKSQTAIHQQALTGMITFILTRIFSLKHAQVFGIKIDGETQKNKHKKKLEDYFMGETHDRFRAFHQNLSKITKQVWRFLKGCMLRKSRQKLYEAQLRPMMLAYL